MGPESAIMSEKTIVKPKPAVKPKTQRPKLWKVILLNDDYTPREFVVQVLKAVFRMTAERAYHVMMTAHRRGACVIAVYTKDVADTKANRPYGRAKDVERWLETRDPAIPRRYGATWAVREGRLYRLSS